MKNTNFLREANIVDISTWKVMIVDDSEDVHSITKLVLADFEFENKSLEFISAYSGQEAIDLITQYPETELLLLDVVMEDDDAGMRVVKYIREVLKNNIVRIILRTGQPGVSPPRSVMANYEINDYQEKAALTEERLYTTITSCLRSCRDLVELRDAKIAAEAATQAKSIFLSNMSHELRTPLNAIMGYSFLLSEGTADIDPDEMTLIFNSIYQAGEHLNQVFSNILDVSQSASGTLNTQYEDMDASALVNRVVALVTNAIENSKNTLVVSCSAITQTLRSDSKMIERAIYQILTNAIKFTENGAIKVTASTFEQDDRTWLRVAVSDNGLGIPQAEQSNIFDMFYQVGKSTTRKYGGCGLGLTLAKYYCETQGGSISVISDLGKGSTFVLLVPDQS